jgi:hypothetical protein
MSVGTPFTTKAIPIYGRARPPVTFQTNIAVLWMPASLFLVQLGDRISLPAPPHPT